MNNDKELCIQTDGNRLKLGSCTENGLLSNNDNTSSTTFCKSV